MKKPAKRRLGKFLKRRILTAVIILIATGASAGLMYWNDAQADKQIASIQQESAKEAAKTDLQIKEILARKAAELKAKQEAAAKDAAEKAITADETTAATIDSTTCNTSKTHNNPAAIDVVVNKKHCIQPLTFAPNDLVDIGNGYLLSSKAAPNYAAMMAAAKAAGYSISITSSYRSYSNQVTTYAYWVNYSGAAGADTYSARPGYSEHQTGLAFDVSSGGCVLDCFGSSAAYSWMLANAADYGFIQRYYAGYESITGYKAEEWHYRYVGVATAKDMQAKGIKTLEQYWKMAGGDYQS